MIAVAQHIESNQVHEVKKSLCFSLLLDKSIDSVLEYYLILYFLYVEKKD